MPAKTKVEIINETPEYYKTNPRGLDDALGSCVYYNPTTGAMCNVGRCCIKPSYLWYGPPSDGILVEGKDSDKRVWIDELLKPEYRGHDVNFWDDLQSFHDRPRFWKANDKGGSDLTSAGYERLEELLARWKDR